MSLRSLLLLTSSAILLRAPVVRADDTARCVESYVQAQKLQRAAELLAARQELIVCADAKCPDVVRSDCLQWLGWNEAAIASVLLEVVRPQAASASSPRLEIDGRPTTVPAPGQPLLLDPGTHRLRCTLPGAEPNEQTIELLPGEKAKVVRIALRAAASQQPGPDAVPGAESVAAYTLWGLGGAGLVAFAILGGVGKAELDDLHESCAPNCTESQVDQAWAKLVAADVSGAVGLAALLVGTIVYLAQPDEAAAETAQGSFPHLDVRPTAGGACVAAGIRF